MLNQDAKDRIHDCLLECDYTPTDEAIALVYDYLPDPILYLVLQWGWSDTEVGDMIFTFIEDKGPSFLE